MLTANLLGIIEFSSFTDFPETPTSPANAILEFVVRSRRQPRLFPNDSLVTCKVEGQQAIALLDHLYMGVGVFVDGCLDVTASIDSQTGNAKAHTVLQVGRLFITSCPSNP